MNLYSVLFQTHVGGERIQCPFCLKCVAISNLGKKMPANTFFFMHHVRKHLAKNSARKCDKCALWFVHKGILKEHQAKDHISCKDDSSALLNLFDLKHNLTAFYDISFSISCCFWIFFPITLQMLCHTPVTM